MIRVVHQLFLQTGREGEWQMGLTVKEGPNDLA